LLGDTDLSDIASDVISTFKDGLSNAWDNVTSWADNAVSRLKNTVSNAVSWVKDRVSGSHRTGLREVPYDGYIAELHKGE
jgi:phage-related protein